MATKRNAFWDILKHNAVTMILLFGSWIWFFSSQTAKINAISEGMTDIKIELKDNRAEHKQMATDIGEIKGDIKALKVDHDKNASYAIADKVNP